MGYIDSFEEIVAQASRAHVDVGHIFFASGSAGTQAGLEAGKRLNDSTIAIHGVSIRRPRTLQAPKVAALTQQTLTFVGRNDLRVKEDDIIIHDAYLGAGYAIPTEAGNEAIRLLGRTEGILLDPVYTGKAFSGLLDIVQRNLLEDERDIVFTHTGGFPAVFHFGNRLRGD